MPNKTKKDNIDYKAQKWLDRQLFFYRLPQHILIMSCVFITAMIFNKYIEAVCYLIAFFSLRYKFYNTYHHEKVWACLCITISMFVISIILIKPLYLSIFSSILFALLDCCALYYVQEFFDARKIARKYRERTIWSMNESELRDFAKSKGLSPQIVETLVLRVIHNKKWVEIQELNNYTREGIRYHRDRINQKLQIKL